VRVNPAFTRVLGWTEDELLNRSFMDFVHPGDWKRSKGVLEAIAEDASGTLRHRMFCKKSGVCWIAWHISHQDGTLFCVGRDVTNARRLLQTLRGENTRIQRAFEQLEHFVSSAGHDLQEPLRTLSMYSELLNRNFAGQMPAGSNEFVVEMLGATGRMRAMLGDMLDYAHSAHQGFMGDADAADFTLVSMESVMNDAMSATAASVAESGASITHDFLPSVFGDHVQLSRLLQNLLSNSVKYRRMGVPLHIHVGVEKRDNEWLFSVADNGLGFNQEFAAQILKPFKRLHGREIPGTGLGLAICQVIVDRHGGKIWAEGKPGEGATMWFTLPTRSPDCAH
jgi:PAS domain S-box-containing protein